MWQQILRFDGESEEDGDAAALWNCCRSNQRKRKIKYWEREDRDSGEMKGSLMWLFSRDVTSLLCQPNPRPPLTTPPTLTPPPGRRPPSPGCSGPHYRPVTQSVCQGRPPRSPDPSLPPLPALGVNSCVSQTRVSGSNGGI